MQPAVQGRNVNANDFLHNLAKEYGVTNRSTWKNNNQTLKRDAYVIDLDSINEGPNQKLGPKDIISRLFNYNKANGTNLTCVPVAGWAEPKKSWLNCRGTVEQTYEQSFSLNPETAPDADIILRMSGSAQQQMKIETNPQGERFLRAPGNTRITDAEQFLAKEKLAFFPHMPTLHVASLAGAAANGSYGPSKAFGPMTTSIVELDIITGTGESKKLTADNENAHLFRAFRDGHLGACYVKEIVLKVTDEYNVRRHDIQMQDRHEFKNKKENLLDEDNFLFMYIPNNIDAKGKHLPRIRVSTFSKAGIHEKRNEPTKNCDDLSTGFKLLLTDIGEEFIQPILTHPELNEFYPLMLNAATIQTFGVEKERTTVGGPSSLHVFKTYSKLGIKDDNWMIKVDGTAHARKVLEDLLDILEPELERLGLEKKYPVLNLFARLQGGVHYPNGREGINSATIDDPNQKILSFEILGFSEHADTPEFKHLEALVEKYLAEKGLKREFHPGKNRPENIHTLTQILTDVQGRKGLEKFQNAVIETHGGIQNLAHSPLFPANKRRFAGLEAEGQMPAPLLEPMSKEKQPQEDREPIAVAAAAHPQPVHKKEVKPLLPTVHKTALEKLKAIGLKHKLPEMTKLAQQKLNMIAKSA